MPRSPKDEQMTENCVLLVLAGPDFDTKREPLAWIGYPAVRKSEDFETQPDASRQLQAWQAAIRDAVTQADTTVPALGHVIHDAGFGSDAAGRRLAQVGHALGTLNPEFDFATQTFNTPKLLGDMRAGTALTNVAGHRLDAPEGQAGAGARHHRTDRLSAVVVTPRPGRASSIPTATGSAPAAKAMPTCPGGAAQGRGLVDLSAGVLRLKACLPA
jgi:hypothetical protein